MKVLGISKDKCWRCCKPLGGRYVYWYFSEDRRLRLHVKCALHLGVRLIEDALGKKPCNIQQDEGPM
jgi:hypothetical protein